MDGTRVIVVYTHQGCPGGNRAIAFFLDHHIPIHVKDIINDLAARDEFQKLGCFATPVIIIDDQKFLGFDEEEVQYLLNENHHS